MLAPASCDDLLGKVGGELLVAQELERIVALALCDGAQIGRVGEHLCHRHLGFDLGHRADWLHALWAPAAAVEVADDVAHMRLGHGQGDVHDRLEQHGVGERKRLLHRLRARELESDLGGVDGVVRAVEQAHAHALDGVAGEHAAFPSPRARPSRRRG